MSHQGKKMEMGEALAAGFRYFPQSRKDPWGDPPLNPGRIIRLRKGEESVLVRIEQPEDVEALKNASR